MASHINHPNNIIIYFPHFQIAPRVHILRWYFVIQILLNKKNIVADTILTPLLDKPIHYSNW